MVEYINLGEKRLPVRISYKVFKQVPTLSVVGEGQYDDIEQLLFLSLQNGHRVLGLPFEITRDQVEDLIDEYPEILGQFSKYMTSQVGELLEKMTGQAQTPFGT